MKIYVCLNKYVLFFYFFFLICFIFNKLFSFWLRWAFVAAHGLSLVVASGGYSLLQCAGFSLQCAGFSLQWLLLMRSMGSRRTGFSICGTRAQYLWLTGSRAQAQKLWRSGLVAPWHVGSSQGLNPCPLHWQADY